MKVIIRNKHAGRTLPANRRWVVAYGDGIGFIVREKGDWYFEDEAAERHYGSLGSTLREVRETVDGLTNAFGE